MDDPAASKPPDLAGIWGLDFEELGVAIDELERRRSVLGTVNPRHAGWHNQLIQLVKKFFARMFSWYARPFIEFDAAVIRSLKETKHALDDVAAYTRALDWRLLQMEKQSARPAENYRTAYIIGLFGSGRQYVLGLILPNIGDRAKYFRDYIRVHPGPTPMIYSGHATIRHACRAQHLPEVTRDLLRTVQAGFADLIFIYRHPLDSLLTNWVWWRTYLRDKRMISGIGEVFEGSDDLSVHLEKNFADFKAFAEGDSGFFEGVPGARFLSFREFVEETELYIQAATLVLRFEDFAIDPAPQFAKIAELIGVCPDVSGSRLETPKSKPYRYLTVEERVPQFKSFIRDLDVETKGRLQKIGYSLSAELKGFKSLRSSSSRRFPSDNIF